MDCKRAFLKHQTISKKNPPLSGWASAAPFSEWFNLTYCQNLQGIAGIVVQTVILPIHQL
jgi:hypothetical protein